MFAYLDTYSQAHYRQFKRINENLPVRSGYEHVLNCIVIREVILSETALNCLKSTEKYLKKPNNQ